jgi:Tol biopolymer transport system component
MISALDREDLVLRLITIIAVLCLSTSIFAQTRQLTTTPYNKCHLRWSPDGQRLSFAGNGKLGYVAIQNGAITFLPIALRGDFYNSWSPDGSSIVFCASSAKGGYHIWTMPIVGGEPKQLTTQTSFMPDWIPDGSGIVYVTNSSGNMDIWKINLENLKTIQLTENTSSDWHPSCSPNSRYVAFSSDRSGNSDIWMISSDGGVSEQLTDTKADEDHVCWSPDSKQIAFVSEQDMRWILCVKDLITQEILNLYESDSALAYLSWSPDGNTIAYTDGLSGFSQIYLIDIKSASDD